MLGTLITPAEIEQLGERGWFLHDGFLSPDEARAARDEVAKLSFRTAGMREGVDPDQRGDQIAWIDPSTAPPALTALCARFEDLRVALAREAWLPTERAEIQAAFYPGGGERYVRHRDAFAQGNRRRITAIVYLNPDWSVQHGGQLQIDGVDIDPLAGRLVVFLSERVEHEVLPAHAPRFAVTAWYYGP